MLPGNGNGRSAMTNSCTPPETYAQRVNRVVEKVYTTDYAGPSVVWAVFEAGTVVMVPAAGAATKNELIALALRVLDRNGRVYPGTSSGDFNPVQLAKFFGDGCAEWFVFFAAEGDFPQGTMMFGVYIGNGGAHEGIRIGVQQRAARENDSQNRQIGCTSFDLQPVIWSSETHASFSQASRDLVWCMLLVQHRLNGSNQSSFVSHEVLLKFVLPMLVQ